jgi:hypothetical protein
MSESFYTPKKAYPGHSASPLHDCPGLYIQTKKSFVMSLRLYIQNQKPFVMSKSFYTPKKAYPAPINRQVRSEPGP